MTNDSLAGAAGIGALVEPARRALYRYVSAQPDAVGREEAAAGVGIPVHSAKFHLDKLVDEGLLEVEFRRLSGRSGPGAGRPAKLYRRSATEFSVSLPERRYDLAGEILAAAVDRSITDGESVDALVHEVARESGRSLGIAGSKAADQQERTITTLDDQGYEPRVQEREIVLANCPFDSLAKRHTALVCGMNESYLAGVLDGLECDQLEACLAPSPEHCCVRIRPRPAESSR